MPWRACRSDPQIPQRRTLRRTCPLPGTGSGISATDSSACWHTTARTPVTLSYRRPMLTRELSPGCHRRLLEEHDADELYAVVAANHEHLARWLPWVEGHTPERSLEFIRATRRSLGANEGLTTGVVVDGAIAGVVGLHEINWMHRSTSAGYWLAEAYQGRGLMT